jgi:hypothetical protein
VDGLIGPLIEGDPWTVLQTLSRARPSAAIKAKIDDRIIKGVVAGKLQQAVVRYWLRATGRGGFPAAKSFLESGLQRSTTATAGVFLLTALASSPGPDAAWVSWAEARYDFSDGVHLALKRMRRAEKRKGKK